MNMVHRFFFSAALVLFALGAYLYFCPLGPKEAGLIIEEPERVFQDLTVGREYDVSFCVHNPTGQRGRIVGIAPC